MTPIGGTSDETFIIAESYGRTIGVWIVKPFLHFWHYLGAYATCVNRSIKRNLDGAGMVDEARHVYCVHLIEN
ncbi:MAG: hypothetical protein EU530_09695 [Promethearchaeota archaeon]|nr:MAG: hypothetical protein EU530_09695 [Candidatus Lokiarchaeota archaeon]